jgi:Bacterial CdiA-CT RNAse A domain
MKNAAPRPGHEIVFLESTHATTRPPWLRHHRQRWLRHDAHLWIRPDAARFFPPGTDPADIYPTLPRRPDAAKAAAFEAEIEAGYRLLAVLREEVASLRAELKRRRELEAKYSPSQPRVPGGNPRGGQRTDRSGGQSTGTTLVQPMGNVDIGDANESSEPAPGDASVDGVQLAGEPVDLLEQEQRGGHTISEHAGMTYDYLKSRARDEARRTLERGDYFDGFSVGSFTSVQSANRLVNSTISTNQDKVDQAIQDGEAAVTINKRFTSPTGYEAYLARAHSEPYIRDTFGVRVIILRDSESARGWRVQSAYPVR